MTYIFKRFKFFQMNIELFDGKQHLHVYSLVCTRNKDNFQFPSHWLNSLEALSYYRGIKLCVDLSKRLKSMKCNLSVNIEIRDLLKEKFVIL